MILHSVHGTAFDVFFGPTFGTECWEGKMCSFWWSMVTIGSTDALILLAWFSTGDASARQIPLYLCVRYAVIIHCFRRGTSDSRADVLSCLPSLECGQKKGPFHDQAGTTELLPPPFRTLCERRYGLEMTRIGMHCLSDVWCCVQSIGMPSCS
jgi:hypothetical protein